MDDKAVLQHLLDLENKAEALVNDAQAEADRRIAEGEKQNRARYDEAYARETETLEASSVQKISAVKEEYRKQLEAYRETLKTQMQDIKAFSSLAEEFLGLAAGSDQA
jgi:vacuolar-type H+-ATPase subunit H